MEPWPPLASYLAFTGFGLSAALVVLTTVLGRWSLLHGGVCAFGVAYGVWSLASVFLFADPGWGSRELWAGLATAGMFSFPVASLVITMALGHWPRGLKVASGSLVASFAVVVVLWSWVGHRFYPGLSAYTLDGTALTSWDHALPWAVFGVNGLGFALGAWGMFRARARQESARLRRQISVVLGQLAAGLGAYVAASAVELFWDLPRMSMVTLLYPLGLNFYLVWKYRYLRFDLPSLGPEIIDALGEAIFLLDPRGQVLKANPAALRLVHDRGARHPGDDLATLFDDPETVRQRWRELVSSRSPVSLDVTLGTGRAGVSLVPHFDAFGDLAGVVAIVDRTDAFAAAASRFGLTPREKEVALLLVQGLSVRQMAEASFVSEATIKTHLLHMYRKAGAHNRVTFLQRIVLNRSVDFDKS